jgi:hypothetical protein
VESKTVSEEMLYKQWINHKELGQLKTINGEDVEVLDIGVFNGDEGGPDFKNSRIRIGNFVFIGDVEIDTNYSDWINHAHNLNNHYNKVILHVSLYNKQNQEYVYTRDGRKIPTLCLSNYLSPSMLESMIKETDTIKTNHAYLKCLTDINLLNEEKKIEILSKMGIERLNKKCERILVRLKELSYLNSLNLHEPVIAYHFSPEEMGKQIDSKSLESAELWEQVFYELIFEALGYSKNKVPMLELAKAANIKFMKLLDKNNFIEMSEAALFNIANLFNENLKADSGNLSQYVRNMVKNWQKIKLIYDGTILTEIEWHFFKLRPQNFPTIRIAGGARFLNQLLNNNLINVLIKKIKEIHNLNVLIGSIKNLFVIKAEGYWKEHYVFEKPIKSEIKYFVGAQRSDEIMVNVIFPLFLVYFEVFNQPQYAKKLLQMYNIFTQKSENNIVNEVAEALGMTKYIEKTIITQGMLEIFRNYCSKNKCPDCPIGAAVFN